MKNIINRLIVALILIGPCVAGPVSFVKFSSQPNDWFEKFEFRARQVEKPDEVRKVFVIVSTDIQSLENELADPKWDRILAQKDIGLVCMGYRYQETLPKGATPKTDPPHKANPAKASALLKEVLEVQIGSYFPRAASYGYLAKGEGGKEAVALATLNARKTLFWIIEDYRWVIPENLKIVPVGLAISRDPMNMRKMLGVQLINQKHKQISFVRDGTEDRKALDRFTIEYISSIIENKGKLKIPMLVDLTTEEAVKNSGQNRTGGCTTWLPSESLFKSWKSVHSLRKEELLERIFEEKVETGIKQQPFLTLHVKLPTQRQGSNIPKGVLCIATWHSEELSLNDILVNGLIRKDLVDWADSNQMAVVTWNTATLWKSGVSQNELKRVDARNEDHEFDAIAMAWSRGMQRLAAKYHLPENGYFLYGLSRGAHWGHRLVLRIPERFAAVHIHVANSYDIPNTASKNVLWLITSGERDAGAQSSIRFYRACFQLGYPVMLKVGANLGHSESSETNAIGLSFFEYARTIHAKNSMSNAAGPALSMKMADIMRNDLKDAKYFGDFINQEVYPVGVGDWVPVAQRVPLVSKEVAEAWGHLNHK